jgi:hypothetical protein
MTPGIVTRMSRPTTPPVTHTDHGAAMAAFLGLAFLVAVGILVWVFAIPADDYLSALTGYAIGVTATAVAVLMCLFVRGRL